MKIGRQLSLTFLLIATGLFAAPTPNSVQNPGSNTLPGLPNYGIAQGSVFVVYGTGGMASSPIQSAQTLPLPTNLNGTSITVTVNGTTVNAYIVYAVATQVAGVLPSNTPVGTGTLTVTYNGASGSTPITVVASNFGILSVNETGTGPAVATHANGSVVSSTNVANTGEEIVIWGTGLGPLASGVSDAAAPPFGNLSAPVTVYVGGVQVPASGLIYHGRNPSDPGLDQINFVVPAGVSGCYVSVAVQTGANLVSNTVTIAVAPSGTTCSDANGISLSSLAPILSSNGTLRIGAIDLFQEQVSITISGVTGNNTESSGSATFEKYTAAQLTGSGSIFAQPSLGSCIINITTGTSTSTTPTLVASGLDAGPAIAVTTPSNNVVNLTSTAATGKGLYTGMFGSLTSGNYKIAGTGGADVGAFSTALTVAAPLNWTNETALASSPINRANPLTITWNNGDPNSFAFIEGFSSATPSGGSPVTAIFICVAPVSANSFTIPPSVLLALPADTTSTSLGYLFVGSAGTPQQFTVPGLDAAFVTSGSIAGTSVTFQ
jgi:uncharacterized protein (TIGR03437 family)